MAPLIQPSWGGGGVTNPKILDAAVDTSKIATDAVTTIKIKDANVTNAKLAVAAVDTGKLATDAVTAVKILDANVTNAKISAGAVDTGKLSTDAVTTIKILDANITTGKIASAAVDTTKLSDGAVTTVKINNGAVDTNKLATDSVTTIKIKDASVDTGKLGPNSVTNAKTNGTTVDCSAGTKALTGAIFTNGLPSGGVCTTVSSGTGDVVLASTQTFTGSNTFGGAGVTTTTFQGLINVADTSTRTYIPSGTSTQGTPSVCNATVTFVNSGFYDVEVNHFGTVQNGTGAGNQIFSFVLMDGGYLPGCNPACSSTVVSYSEESGTANGARNARYTNYIPKTLISAGSHTFCVGYGSNSATTVTFPSTFATIKSMNNSFRVSAMISQ